MIENFKAFGKQDEVDFEKNKFKGKLAGKAWQYSKHLDGVIRTRVIIFAMAFIVLYRVLAHKIFNDFFSFEFLIERIIFSSMFILSAILYNKLRVLSFIVAIIPLVIILAEYILGPGGIKIIGFQGGILLLVLIGIYNNFKLKQLRKELESQLIENQLID